MKIIPLDIPKYVDICYNAADKNGWHDDIQSIEDFNDKIELLYKLIISEAYEAFEAIRTSKIFVDENNNLSNNLDNVTNFKEEVKDTFQDELADIFIRICDFLGSIRKWYKDYELPKSNYTYNIVEIINTPSDEVIRKYLSFLDSFTHNMLYHHIDHALNNFWSLINDLNIDIEKFIQAKLEYNSTRGYKHGNKNF